MAWQAGGICELVAHSVTLTSRIHIWRRQAVTVRPTLYSLQQLELELDRCEAWCVS
jgi:hypothetical protein